MHKVILVPIDLNHNYLTDKVISEINEFSVNKNTHFYFLTVISPPKNIMSMVLDTR